MRKKLLTKTYLRDVTKYTIKIDISNDDYWYSVKHIIETEPFVINDLKLIDNGYYMLELLPKDELYSMRVYFNENKEIIDYYFDISLGNGIDEDTKVPYYDDAFLDVTYTNGVIQFLDENELDDARNEGRISDDEYKTINEAGKKLANELSSKDNKYVNMNLSELL